MDLNPHLTLKELSQIIDSLKSHFKYYFFIFWLIILLNSFYNDESKVKLLIKTLVDFFVIIHQF